MLKWLKKFVLDILPSVAATIIGAYIVNHYIVPKSQSGGQPSITSAISDAFASKSSDGVADKASFEKGVAEKTAIEKTAEKAASDKATAAEKTSDGVSDSAVVETRKARAASKVVAKPTPKSVESAPVPDERRASDLARAALERQRNSANAELAKAEPPKMADAARLQTVSTTGSVPPPMQPLPPAISITTPNADVFEQGNAAPVLRQPYPQPVARADDSRRFVPPADIPGSRPLDLRAEASTSSSDRTSVTDEVVSVAKSMFHAVMPR